MLRHVVIILVALAALSSAALAERRVALVIGNDGYRQIGRLLKARGDADAMAATLKTMGFETTLAHDLDNLGFGLVLDRFVASLEPTDTALFFFAGHGVEFDGTNYLLPTDMPYIDPGQTQFQRSAYKVREIVDRIRQKSVRVAIAVIDACRDNPLRAAGRRGSATRGLGRMEAEAGEFLLFSAGPQQAALDRLSDSDASPTSVFTRVFVKHLPTPGASLVEIAKRTQSEVVELARTAQWPHAQFPAYDDRILGNFSLVPQVQPAVAATVPAVPLPSTAQAEFELARAIGTAAAWDAFLARNPTGFLADTARKEREKLAGSSNIQQQQQVTNLPPSRPVETAEQAAFAMAQQLNSREAWRAFLVRYGAGPNAELARAALARIEVETASLTQLPVAPPEQLSNIVTAAMRQCALLAAHPFDGGRLAGIPGVLIKNIVAAKAVPACREALSERPTDPRLMFQLGRALEAGKINGEAVRIYRAAAEAGFGPAMYSLGSMYADGQGVAKDAAEAVRWYRKGADDGNADAMNGLARMYMHGRGVAKDEAEAARLHRKAADVGDAIAMANLGWMYKNGRGVAKDEAEAARWYRKAADAGDTGAMVNLGWMYQNSRGVAKDSAAAVRWYRKAANAGNAAAMNNLGWMYEAGQGVAKSWSEAIAWYRRAAAAGNRDSREALKRAGL